MKRLVFIALAMLMMVPALVSAKTIQVGINQIVEHPALDATRNGIIDTLKKHGFEEGKNIAFDIQIAQGNMATANTIAKKFVGDEKDLVIGIATPTALALANATNKIPVVISAVTDPVGARLVKTIEKPGGNVTGVSDLTPVKEQINLLNMVGLNVKKLGIIYNAGEQNSRTLVGLARKACKDYDMTLVEATVTNTSGVLMAAKSLAGRVDAIYIPTDNTVVSALESVLQVGFDNKIPVIMGDTDSVERGALGALGFNYYKHGLQTGEIVARILKGEKPGDIAVEFQKELELYINLDAAKKMGVTVPQAVIDKADKVIR